MTRMKPPFFHVFLSLLVISFRIHSTAESSKDDNLSPLTRREYPITQVERMIRGLNLFPELDVNINGDEPADSEPKLVEKRIRLPILSDTGATVENLGHHAGYFKLPHSRNARYTLYIIKTIKQGWKYQYL